MPRLLIVDDQEQNLYMLQVLLQGHGYEVQSARNGIEALDIARREAPDLVITDILMPGMDGFSLCRAWMADEKLRHIPLVFYTATYTDPQDEAFALSLGAARFVVKPTEPDAFVEILRQALEDHTRQRLASHDSPSQAAETYYEQYAQTLIRKLEDKMVQLEAANQALERDIAERLRTAEALARQASQLTLLNETGRRVAAVLDLDQVLQEAARLVQESFCYHHVGLFTREAEAERLAMKARAGEFASVFPPDHKVTLGQGIVGWVGLHGETLLANDVAAEPRYVNLYPDRLPTRSELSVPIRIGDEILGVLDLQSPQPNAFDPGDVTTVETLAGQIAVAITNARLYSQAAQRNRELSLLNRVIAATAAAASQGIEPVLRAVCRELALAFEVPEATAALFNKENSEAVVVAEYLAPGRPSALGESIAVVGNSAAQHLVANRMPLVIEDAQNDPRQAVRHERMRRRGTVSLLLLPLLIEGEVVGNLQVHAVEPRPFSAEEVDLARRVAEQASGALARARLEETQQLLSAAVEQAAETVIITDTQDTILYVNPAFERISGYSRDEALGQTPHLLDSGKQDTAFYRDLWETIGAGRVWQGRFVNRKKDGSLYTEEATITPVRNRAGEIVNYVTVKRDVTRELQLEEQFHQAQKMEAVGRLAGGIAHDFNNLLTVIHLSTQLLERKLHSKDPLRPHVQLIREAGERAGSLTKQLLTFSRRGIIEPQVISLNRVVEELNRMLRRLIGEDIRLTVRPAKDLWPIQIDPGQVEQVVVNLVVNARDAMPTGGKLTIEMANTVLDEVYVASHLDVEPGEYVLLAVSDTGVGMSEEVKACLFEPFFTTKEKGRNTGLGLATVFGIVKQNGGHIWVYSEVGQGTTFKIYFPRATDGLPTPARPLQRPVATRGTETLLLVEDDSLVRVMTRDILLGLGYQVLTAGDGVEAIQVAEAYQGPIHLLLTDVVMPRLSGKELADRLRSNRPELRVLYTSGYTDNAIVHHGVLAEGTHFLSKPFELESLARKVRDVLDAGS
ncbi:MAG: response regulator [Anaerolineae bacterium]